jgi:hypothetical protein
MQYWKNISARVQPVPVGNGDVVAVRPQGEVEVVAESAGLLRLRAQGKIVRTGRPLHHEKVARGSVVQAPERHPVSTEFAQHVVERGATQTKADMLRENEMRKAQRAAAAADAAPVNPEVVPVVPVVPEAVPAAEAPVVVQVGDAPVVPDPPSAMEDGTDGRRSSRRRQRHGTSRNEEN